MRLPVTAVAVVLLAGCVKPYSASSGPVDRPLPPSIEPQGGSGPGTPREKPTKETSKRVAQKEAPNTLISDDNSRCYVSNEEFQQTPVGLWVKCQWAPPPGKMPGTGGL